MAVFFFAGLVLICGLLCTAEVGVRLWEAIEAAEKRREEREHRYEV